MWRIAAKLLWAFEFAEPMDATTGRVCYLGPSACNPGILQALLLFEMQIKPRSAEHVKIIKSELRAA
jgi:hypothetical protein